MRVLPGLFAASRQTQIPLSHATQRGLCRAPVRILSADPLLQQRAPLSDASLERIGIAQVRHDRSQPVPVAGGTTEDQALLQHTDRPAPGPLGRGTARRHSRGQPSALPPAFRRGEAEQPPPRGAGPRRRPRARSRSVPARPGPGSATLSLGVLKRPVRHFHIAPQQLGRPTEVADSIVYLPQTMGCSHLQSTIAERGCELEGLLAGSNRAVEVSRHPEYLGYPGQHPYQPGPIAERPGHGLGLAQQGEAPPIPSHCVQRGLQSEAELDGQHPGVAGLGQVREGLQSLVEVGHPSRNAARS